MNPGNLSTVSHFIFLGLTNAPELKVLLFIILLPVYIFTLLGNATILFLVWHSIQLHTPMYFFVTQLSFLDIIFSSVVSPKMLADLLTEKKVISFSGCITQIYFFGACATTEFLILTAMAYDRYVAICKPLIYTLIMTKILCQRLVVGSFIGGFLHSLIHAGGLLRLSFCGPNVMNHFVCDYPPLLKLSCTDSSINNLVRIVFAIFMVGTSLVIILVSYTFIVTVILRIPTSAGRRQAVSTCSSHFTCLFLYFGSLFFMEILPNSRSLEEGYKVVCVILTVFIPALNPLIYSLRNKEVKEVLRKKLHNASHF